MHSSRETVPARVWIEVDVQAASIAGALHRGDDPVRPFSGWLELVALLENLRQPAAGGGGPSEPPIDPP
ncbi:MAG: hypothetical protein QOF55_1883 [Thermoleophilaceae bacterium]|jgi:hypothetical protein|nr:hypothetical protein [Thermoleophilaceae bacterium]